MNDDDRRRGSLRKLTPEPFISDRRCRGSLTPISPLPPAPMLSMNRLDYNRLA